MKPSAAEALKAAIRRAIPITIALIVLGAVAVNAIRQLQGPRYEASARVVHSNTDLAAALTGTQPAYIDPRRAIETALALARSPELYDRAAERDPDLGRSGMLRASTRVDGGDDTDVLVLTSSRETPELAIETVNLVAAEYIRWRSEITGEAIRRAIEQVEQQLATPRDNDSGTTPSNRAALQRELTRLQLLETLSSGGATLIERAERAVKTTPRPIRDTLFGGALGFVIALLISGAREAFNTRVRSEADVEAALGRPVLASIQTLPKRVDLVTVGRHESRWGDTYALLAANVMQIRGKADRTVIAVTSAIAGEGKTTTAANLAVAMAQRGQRVVLVDFDLRKPSVARIFRIPPESPGVIQVVDGRAELERAVWSVPLNGAGPAPRAVASGNGHAEGDLVLASDNGSLRVVAAGGNERGARIARSPIVPEFLSELADDADVVILDTPPALATVEMAELSRSVDMVIAVVRHGRVTRRSLVALSRQADGWQTDIVGAVLTDAPPEEDEYYYYR
jgi:succinoglycan biosynthesis transport protein ExoP